MITVVLYLLYSLCVGFAVAAGLDIRASPVAPG